jgi:hypothetical protein
MYSFMHSSAALQSLQGPWPPHTGGFVTLLRNSVGLLWTSDQLVAKASTYTQHTKTRTDIHTLSGIRTHGLSVKAIKTFASDRAATGIGLSRKFMWTL